MLTLCGSKKKNQMLVNWRGLTKEHRNVTGRRPPSLYIQVLTVGVVQRMLVSGKWCLEIVQKLQERTTWQTTGQSKSLAMTLTGQFTGRLDWWDDGQLKTHEQLVHNRIALSVSLMYPIDIACIVQMYCMCEFLLLTRKTNALWCSKMWQTQVAV